MNDKAGKDTQARAWQLTLNNPLTYGMTHDEIKKILNAIPSKIYWCLCDEIGEQGTPHTHVYLKTRNPLKFMTLKNKFPSAHLEKAQGTPQENRDYIKKEGKWANTEKKETNLPETFEEWGEVPKGHKGKRTDLSILFDMIEDGLSNAEILRQNPNYMKYFNIIERTRQALIEEAFQEWRDIECIYVYGETNTNKTRTYMEKYGYKNVCRITNYSGNAVWDSYKGQDVVIFEEYRSQLMISELLTWLEGYPNSSMRARYTDKVACYTKVILISNIPLEEQYPNVQKESPETWRAFLRRIQRVYHHITKEKIIEYKSIRDYMHRDEGFKPLPKGTKTPFDKKNELPDYSQEKLPFDE